jgi:hypothetical protein
VAAEPVWSPDDRQLPSASNLWVHLSLSQKQRFRQLFS